MAQGESTRVTIALEEEISRHYVVTSLLSVRCQKSKPNTLGQQGTPVSSVTLVHNLQLLYWQAQGQNQELQIYSSTKMPFLSPFIFLKMNPRRKHHCSCCSLTTVREKMQPSIFQMLSSTRYNLTNDEDCRQSVTPLHGPQSLLAPSLLHTAGIKTGESVSSSRSLAQATAEEDTIAVRCGLFRLIAPSLLWTNTPSNSLHNHNSSQLKEEERED